MEKRTFTFVTYLGRFADAFAPCHKFKNYFSIVSNLLRANINYAHLHPGVHPKPKGYQFINKTLAPVLDMMLGFESRSVEMGAERAIQKIVGEEACASSAETTADEGLCYSIMKGNHRKK